MIELDFDLLLARRRSTRLPTRSRHADYRGYRLTWADIPQVGLVGQASCPQSGARPHVVTLAPHAKLSEMVAALRACVDGDLDRVASLPGSVDHLS